MKCDEQSRHWDATLGYYEGGSSISSDSILWSPDNVRGWMLGVDDVNSWENLIFLDHSWQQITETAKGEAKNKKELLYLQK